MSLNRSQTLEERVADLEAMVINQADRIEALERLIETTRAIAVGRIRHDLQKQRDEAA